MDFLRGGTCSTVVNNDNGLKDPDAMVVQLFTQLDLTIPADTQPYFAQYLVDKEEDKLADYGCLTFEAIAKNAPVGANESYGCIPSIPGITRRSMGGAQSTKTNQHSSPFRWESMDVMFPSGLWLSPTPYSELYPFPSAPITTHQSTKRFPFGAVTTGSPRSEINPDEIEERLENIERLRQVCSENHGALIMEMYEVAAVYYNAKRYAAAEYWYRQIIKTTPSRSKRIQWVVVASRVILSRVLYFGGKFLEAKRTHQIAHRLALNNAITGWELTELTFEIGAEIAESLDQNSDAETFNRQVAQMRLTRHGPRFEGTILSLQGLAKAMYIQEKYSESRDLLWILMDLGNTSLKSSIRAHVEVACLLARLMHKQGLYRDAESLWRISLQEAHQTWGPDHCLALKSATGLARALKFQGEYAESETLLRRNIPKLLKANESEPTSMAFFGLSVLAGLLMTTGRYGEAGTWWETGIEILSGGFEYTGFPILCYANLVICYSEEGRFNDCLRIVLAMKEAAKGNPDKTHHLISVEERSRLISDLDRLHDELLLHIKEAFPDAQAGIIRWRKRSSPYLAGGLAIAS